MRVTPTLQTADRPEVFAVGDVAATDPLRCSARNRADGLLADNVRAHLSGEPLGTFRPSRVRWGSVLGIQPHGIEVFLASGSVIRFPLWCVERVLLPWYLYRGVYGGIRRRRRPTACDTPFEQLFAWCLIRSNMCSNFVHMFDRTSDRAR